MLDISNRFNFLAGAYHLAYYFPRNHGGNDDVSEHILHFKDNVEPWTGKWISIASDELNSAIPAIDIVIRVLGSTERSASGNTSLDKLARSLAKRKNAIYAQNSLTKTRSTRALKYLSRAERQQELNGLYRFTRPKQLKKNNPVILLIDDIITSGTTIKEVNRAVKTILPGCNLYVFSVGKTYDSWNDKDVNNDNILRKLTQLSQQKPKPKTNTDFISEIEANVTQLFDEPSDSKIMQTNNGCAPPKRIIRENKTDSKDISDVKKEIKLSENLTLLQKTSIAIKEAIRRIKNAISLGFGGAIVAFILCVITNVYIELTSTIVFTIMILGFIFGAIAGFKMKD